MSGAKMIERALAAKDAEISRLSARVKELEGYKSIARLQIQRIAEQLEGTYGTGLQRMKADEVRKLVMNIACIIINASALLCEKGTPERAARCGTCGGKKYIHDDPEVPGAVVECPDCYSPERAKEG